MADETLASPPKKKKLPFKPTALRKTAAAVPAATGATASADRRGSDTREDIDSTNDALQLFSRAREMAPIMAADRERRLLKKQKQQEQRQLEEEERRRAQEQRRRPSVGEKRHIDDEDEEDEILQDNTDGQGNPGDSSKTQQMDGLEGGEHYPKPSSSRDNSFRDSVTPSPAKRPRHSSTPSPQKAPPSTDRDHSLPDGSPPPRSLRSGRATPSKSATASPRHPRTTRNAPIISLDSDSEGDDVQVVSSAPMKQPASLEVIDRDPTPDEPFGGASAQQQQQQTGRAGRAEEEEEDEEDEFAEYERRAAEQRARDLAEAGREQIHILVTSNVPGAEQCYVKFLFNKPLRLVRDSWVALQLKKGVHLPADQRDDVLLTWRRKRVYNTSTLLHLGIRPAGGGRVEVDGFGSEGLGDNRTRIHMEAWTLDLFQKMEREEELRRRREAGEPGSSSPGAGDGSRRGSDRGSEAPPPAEVKLRVTLKARDVEDVKLTVRPETTVETLITGFRAQRHIDPGMEVSLWFDGERLDDDSTMADAEIDDFDAIEVHIKTPREGIEISDEE